MLNALAYAFVDAVNVLLIGVLVALAMMSLPGRYRSIAALLLAGNWFGVIALALVVLLVFDGLGDVISHVVDSPVFGSLLILTGIVTAVLTFRGGEGSSALIDRILTPLRSPSPLTVVVGIILGLVQSATSVPFYAGLAVLSASGIPANERYLGLFLYASVAVSLPLLAGLALGVVRHRPQSWIGRTFATARTNQAVVARVAGYAVAALLVVIGIARLL